MKCTNGNLCFMENNIGSWIKKGLADIRKNQAWLAGAVGLQPPQISRIISGSSEATPDVLNRIADALRKPRIEAYRAAGHFSEKTDEDPYTITPPKIEQREIVPFTQAEFKAILGVVSKSKAYDRPGKRKSDHSVIHPERTRAILLMLLDTGLRCGELTSLKIIQLDQRNQRVQVLGKGALERSIPFSPRTGQALWRYLSTRPDAMPGDPLFTTYNNRPIAPTQLNKSIRNLGVKAGVTNVHPHRFRHTFAIQYLRNGGDPYTLQKLMGHSTLDMVKRYLALAQIDIDKAHRRASPVDNWTL